jgi:hypothetical protein
VGVTHESDGVVFRSPDLDVLSDARTVRERAVERVAVFSGLSRIAEGDGKARAVSVGAIFREDGARRDTFVAPASVELRVRGRAAELRGPRDPATPVANVYAAWAAAAERDEKVMLALKYFGSEPSAESLWKVYEVIRDDAGGKANIVKYGWATPDEIDSFRSVHYPSVYGEKARHGIEPTGQPAPTAPMSLSEARKFIGRLLKHWLALKYSARHC